MASFFGSHVPRAPTTMASYVTEYPRSRAPTSWSGHRRRQRQCFQTRLQHQAKSLTAFPRQRPQDQAACSTQSPASGQRKAHSSKAGVSSSRYKTGRRPVEYDTACRLTLTLALEPGVQMASLDRPP
ncbi:conserved hypothetical protein [Trichinella spiralis]|uniref:hypothetical protein n=1 Tax=Trichinella spiralis TaxID=6334 RepID=UPI0001EFE252|nr:conserved hypothetical protein [Trichinella spiralis]